MANEDATPWVCFGTYSFNRETLELRRGDRAVRLQQQPARVLAYLSGRPGELVARSDLADHLWGDTHVDVDQGLNNAVRHLRNVLRDNAESPLFVETVPKLGYRFLAPVTFSARAERVAADGSPAAAEAAPVRFAGQKTVWLFAAAIVLIAAGWWLSQTDLLPFFHAGPEAEYLLARSRGRWTEARTRAQLQEALTELNKALRVIRDVPEARLLRAEMAYYFEWDAANAEREYRQALQLGGGIKEVQASYAFYALLRGQAEEARQHAEIALDLDPTSADTHLVAGMIALRLGHADEAFDLCRRAEELGQGALDASDCLLGAFRVLGDTQRALTHMKDWIRAKHPPSSVMDRIQAADRPEESLVSALRWRQHLLFLAARRSPDAPESEIAAEGGRPLSPSIFGEIASRGRLAAASALAGDFDSALQWLRLARQDRSPSFLRWVTDPAFEPLLSNADYLEILKDAPLSRPPFGD